MGAGQARVAGAAAVGGGGPWRCASPGGCLNAHGGPEEAIVAEHCGPPPRESASGDGLQQGGAGGEVSGNSGGNDMGVVEGAGDDTLGPRGVERGDKLSRRSADLYRVAR